MAKATKTTKKKAAPEKKTESAGNPEVTHNSKKYRFVATFNDEHAGTLHKYTDLATGLPVNFREKLS